ncbi:MAG: hypothetical protein ACI857_001113 [Arenicella sp.]|jgi:hypothetical protein
MGAIKTKLLSKKSRLQIQRNIWLKKPAEIKKILLVSNSDAKSLKRKAEETFDNAGVHHLFIREVKEDTTIGFYYSVHESDFNLTAILKNEKLQNLLSMDFDLLIDLSEKSAILSYFVNQSKASLKIGPINTKQISTYDVLIDLKGSEADKISNIYTHLNTLKQDAKI